jgi:hypothetical protein
MSTNQEIVGRTFETAALLRGAGLEFLRPEAFGNRINLVFRDEDGRGAELLRDHENGRLMVNSRKFLDGWFWAKSVIFAAKG